MFDIVIIGGGAAGFFAALKAAEVAGSKPLSIVILEKTHHPLAKVLISGGGRCNVTHACFDPAQLVEFFPRGADVLRGAFSRFQPADTIAWFENHGVPLKTESDGRVFPRSDSSRSIVDCILKASRSAGIEVRLNTVVETLEIDSKVTGEPGFHLRTSTTGRIDQNRDFQPDFTARQVLLATGGDRNSLSLATSLGHSIKLPVPSLFSFQIVDPRLDGLSGLSVDPVSLTLEENTINHNQRTGLSSQEGPVLITHWGLSGPAVLKLSAWGARWLHARKYKAGLRVSWLHPLNPSQVVARLIETKNQPSQGAAKITSRRIFPQIPLRLWDRLVMCAGISEEEKWASLTRVKMERLALELIQAHYTIQGKGPFKDEFVTCGGIKLDEINFKTMESRIVPGLFFAGEVLDIDGLTGGFNFQNAWTTGWLAGYAMSAGNSKLPY